MTLPMSARAAFVLGVCLMIAALLHGGVWAPGHDFIVNRFTGRFVFVPSNDPPEEDATDVPTHAALTTSEADGRFNVSLPRR